MTVLPKGRRARAGLYLGLGLGYVAALWFWLFPWIDRTFVNRPAL